MLYKITRKMWIHQNERLFKNKTASTSLKQSKAVMGEVKIHLKIVFSAIRNKGKKIICPDLATLKKWKTPMLEASLHSMIFYANELVNTTSRNNVMVCPPKRMTGLDSNTETEVEGTSPNLN